MFEKTVSKSPTIRGEWEEIAAKKGKRLFVTVTEPPLKGCFSKK